MVSQKDFNTACYKGDLYFVKKNIKYIDVNMCDDRGLTPLAAAINGKSLDVIKFLLSNKVDVNGTFYEPKSITPLHLAIDNAIDKIIQDGLDEIKNEHENIIKLLLKNGADTNSADFKGKNPLEYAITPYKEIIEIWIKEKDKS